MNDGERMIWAVTFSLRLLRSAEDDPRGDPDAYQAAEAAWYAVEEAREVAEQSADMSQDMGNALREMVKGQ